MKTIGLNGKTYNLVLKPQDNKMRSAAACKSKIQYECGQYLRSKLPFDVILEEQYIPDGFYLDFFLPNRRIVIEVDGRQHDEYVEYFHGSKEGFAKSKQRDADKELWCKMNEIALYKVKSINELKELFE